MPDLIQQQYYGAYRFLSAFYRRGLTPELFETAGAIPVLAPLLPTPFDADEAAALHQDLLGFNVLPHAGVFLAEDGKLGGDLDYLNSRFYEAFSFDPAGEAPDHIGTQLAFLAHLVALTAASPEMQHALQQAQADFLRLHLMPWVHPFLFALKGQHNPFYHEIAELTAALLIAHLRHLGPAAGASFPLPEPPDILADRKTGMKQIALFLLRPVFSGIYLSKQEIRDMSRSLHLPGGFGDRGQLLSNVFQAALNFDAFPQLLDLLATRTAAFRDHYYRLGEEHGPEFAGLLAPWLHRTDKTLALLDELQSSGARLSTDAASESPRDTGTS